MTTVAEPAVGQIAFDTESVAWVFDADSLGFLLTAIETSTEVVLDLESTGLAERATLGGFLNDGYPARIVLASLTLPQDDDADPIHPTTWVVPLSHPASPWVGQWRLVMTRIARTILDYEKPLNNQNVKFDCRWIYAHTGIDLSHRITWDTRIGAHLLDETKSTKLKEGVPRDFGVAPWNEFPLDKPGAAERVPLFELGIYAAQDTFWTYHWSLMQKRRMHLIDREDFDPETPEEIEEARLGKLAIWCSIPTTATLTAMEQRGIGIDVPWVLERIQVNEQRRDELTESLATRYGMDPADASWAATSGWFMEWTEKAVAAGDLRVAAITDTGRPSWSKGVLIRQARNGSEVAQDLLEARKMVKQLEFLRVWRDNAVDGRIYTTYNAGSVVTGRLSSDSPNMQQVTKVLRPAFIPSPGYVMADFDYSQLEMRIAAFISRSEPMMQAFRDGVDTHMLMAERITGKPKEEVLPYERQGAKAGNFGLLFGMGAGGLRDYAEVNYGVSFTEDEAQAVYDAFFDLWQLKPWHAKCIAKARFTGQCVSPIGRVRRLGNYIYSDNPKMVSFGERASINSPVQGFGSDLMQTAAASIEGNIPGVPPVPQVRLVATVHDSIVAELPEDNWEKRARQCQERMVALVPKIMLKMGCVLDVPLAADVSVGTRWSLSDVGKL